MQDHHIRDRARIPTKAGPIFYTSQVIIHDVPFGSKPLFLGDVWIPNSWLLKPTVPCASSPFLCGEADGRPTTGRARGQGCFWELRALHVRSTGPGTGVRSHVHRPVGCPLWEGARNTGAVLSLAPMYQGAESRRRKRQAYLHGWK